MMAYNLVYIYLSDKSVFPETFGIFRHIVLEAMDAIQYASIAVFTVYNRPPG